MSPRQKMINLMYVVLMAMLALNVSSDVLNGFFIGGRQPSADYGERFCVQRSPL